MKRQLPWVLTLSMCGLPACGATPLDAPADAGDDAAPGDAGPSAITFAEGTCSDPIEIRRDGVRYGAGSATLFRGTTAGARNSLHPSARCAASDAGEVVFRYRVPMGAQTMRIDTLDSDFDTVLYVRSSCKIDGRDRVCDDDSADHAPHSTVFLRELVGGEVLFIIVDGSGASDASSGRFTLSLRDLPYGEAGTPCRLPRVDENVCSLRLRCAQGASPDGTDLCLATVRTGRACDPRGYHDTCEEGSTCAVDSGSPEAMYAGAVCTIADVVH